jgi:CheY-like chemotaxis protein/anti-sigma regulatory factor (Ser/Thr protein kinase)
MVRGDPARLRQVLLNLIGNAVKFTDRGTVELSVDAAPVSRGDGLRLRFAVRDTGIGIDEATQARLFTPFAQADGARAQARGGTGLGLAIAQRLVAAMGSHIHVESQPGVGSTFSFEIEMPLAESAVTTPPSAAIAGLLHGRVLLAEDNPVNRVITTEMLRRLGLDVEEAENGLLAIEALQRRQADLVLMDQQMPVLDGMEATARIRSCEAGADAAQVPIVAITANAQEGDAQRCLDAGMNDYLAKPFTQAELAATLRRWLRTR